MRKENVAIKKKRLLAAQDTISKILAMEDFRITKELKYGPRFLIAEVVKRKKRAMFKICLFIKSLDRRTNSKFSREILFLKFIGDSKYSFLKKSVPKIYAFSLTPRAWYIREYLTGNIQNFKGGDIRFKKSFFNDKNLHWVIKFFTALQSINNRELPFALRRHLLRATDFDKQLWTFIKPHFELIEGYLRMPGISKQFYQIISKYIPIYNQAPIVLSHQEPYSSHFIKNDGSFTLIDWENVNWANPFHDLVILWMRAYDHPVWQKKLYQNFKKLYQRYDFFDDLWTIETFVQSCFNIISYYFHYDTQDLKGLAKFSAEKIKEIINKDFKICN